MTEILLIVNLNQKVWIYTVVLFSYLLEGEQTVVGGSSGNGVIKVQLVSS